METTAPKRGVRLFTLVLLIGLALAVVIVGLQLANQNRTQPRSGPAPQFSITTYDGQTVSLESLRGRVVVLNFWGSWCAPCRDEAPYLQALSDEYGDRGVVVLGISYLDTVRGARNFIDEFNLTYLNAPDQEARIATTYAVQGAPETFVIDREGNIALFILGAVDLPENEPRLRATLETLLGG